MASMYIQKWRWLFEPTQLWTHGQWLSCCLVTAVYGRGSLGSLIVFGDASLAPPTMLTAKGLPDHALNTEIVFIKFPEC